MKGFPKVFDESWNAGIVAKVEKEIEDILLEKANAGLNVGLAGNIGDSTTDAKTARNAGVAFVAVLTGVTKREDFAEYSPLVICEEFGELLHVLEKK